MHYRRRRRPASLRTLTLATCAWFVASLCGCTPGRYAGPVNPYAGTVFAIAVSPKGDLLASAEGANEWNHPRNFVRLWDPNKKAEIRKLPERGCAALAVTFFDKGERLIAGGQDTYFHVWDLQAFTEIREVFPRAGWINSLALSPDGECLVLGGVAGTVGVWSVVSGEKLWQFESGHTANVTAVAYSPRGRIVASGGDQEDPSVRTWDARTGKAILVLKGHWKRVCSLAFSPDGSLLASASKDGTVMIWDPVAGKLLDTLRGHGDCVYCVAFSPDGKQVASGAQDMTLRLWDPKTGNQLRKLKGHTGGVTALAYFPDGKTIATGSYDDQILFWNVETGTATSMNIAIKPPEDDKAPAATPPAGKE